MSPGRAGTPLQKLVARGPGQREAPAPRPALETWGGPGEERRAGVQEAQPTGWPSGSPPRFP